MAFMAFDWLWQGNPRDYLSLLKMNQRTTYVVFFSVMLVRLTTVFRFLADDDNRMRLWPNLAQVFLAFFAMVANFSRLPPIVYECIKVVVITGIVASGLVSAMETIDPVFRARNTETVSWTGLVITFLSGTSHLSCGATYTIYCFLVAAFGHQMSVRHGGITSWWYVSTGLISVAFYCTTYVKIRVLKDLHNVLDERRAALETQETLLSLVCDATCFLDETGVIVKESSLRFNALLGKAMKGSPFDEVLNGAEEGSRLRAALATSLNVPTALPLNLVSALSETMTVDCSIVARHVQTRLKADQKDPSFSRGFLVGFNVVSHNPAENTDYVRQRQLDDVIRAANINDSLPVEESSYELPVSFPDTNGTGAALLIDHNTMGKELAERLEHVAEIGKREGWYVEASDLSTFADSIIGVGSFGAVVSGNLFGRPVAVKVSTSELNIFSLTNELRVLRRVNHPSIVYFRGACVEPESCELALVLECVKGVALDTFVELQSRLLADASKISSAHIRIIDDLVSALKYLHGLKPAVVHGDLKASNVLVETTTQQAKLVDFGLSRVLTKSARPLGGTLRWMAPEIIRNPGRPQASADVFSWGHVVCLLLTGNSPLQGATENVIVSLAFDPSTEPVNSGRKYQGVLGCCQALSTKALSYDPAARPTMQHISKMLKRVIGAESLRPNDGEVDLLPLRMQVNRVRKALDQSRSSQSPDREQESDVLVLPHLACTVFHWKKVMLLNVVSQWNFRVPATCCCPFHAALSDVANATSALQDSKCHHTFSPFIDGVQCPDCGVIASDSDDGGVCGVCDFEVVDRTRMHL
mmetsp:Transcript_14559/g.39998  ORF Transcript_14559/g.39998 Transcript_14559/m.39998 type:complete len:814 (-) Transcript_14559:47-2488(-)